MDSPATRLYRLQNVDQAIAQHRTRLKEIHAALNQSEAVQQASTQVAAVTSTLKPWQVRARDLELEIKGVVGKMTATEERLYSGQVNNPKTMQEMQSEIAALKRTQARLEDHLLEAMMHSEDGQAQLDAAQTRLSAAQTLHDGQRVDLLAEKERLEASLPKLDAQRHDMAATIAPDVLAAYESLRPKKGRNIVALLQDTSCTACGVEQTLSLVQKVREDKTLVSCATCGRILAPRS